MIPSTRQLALLLFALSSLVYLLLFSGLPVSTDEIALFSGVQSLSQRGVLSATPLYWNENGTVLFGSAGHAYPSFEPMQMLLAAPLHWLGRHLPNVGLLPIVWLFNVLVTALTVVLLFLCALRLGYQRQIGFLLALLFGFGTIALPYARTFFREPLTTFFLLLAFYSLLTIAEKNILLTRSSQFTIRNSLPIALLFGSGIGGAYATKVSTLLPALPLIVGGLIALRSFSWRWRGQGLFWGTLGFCLFASPLWWSAALQDMGSLVAVAARDGLATVPRTVEIDWQQLLHGSWGLLFSPGKSVFLYSPVLCFGVLGLPWFVRRHWLAGLAALGFCAIYTAGYALTKGDLWFGGLNWGPRFLVPITPFVLLLALPVIDFVYNQAARDLRLVFAIFCGLSIGVQLLATLVPLSTYSEQLTRLAPDAMWTLSIDDWRYTPFVYYWHLLSFRQIDWLWLRQLRVDGAIDLLSPVIGGVGLLLLSWQAKQILEQKPVAEWTKPVFAVPLLLAVTLLYRSAIDPRLPGGDDRHALVATLNQQVQPSDAILLSDANQLPFYLNTVRSIAPIYAYNPVQGVLSEKENQLFLALQGEFAQVWLVSHDNLEGMPLPRARSRADEAWWNAHAGKIMEQSFSPYARISIFISPAGEFATEAVNVQFGDEITLVQIKRQRENQPLYFEFLWQADSPPTRDYTFFFQVLDPQGTLVWQQDQQPQHGFAPTSSWQAGQTVRDFVVVPPAVLPAATPLSDYRIILGLYFFDQSGYPQRLQTSLKQDYLEIATH